MPLSTQPRLHLDRGARVTTPAWIPGGNGVVAAAVDGTVAVAVAVAVAA